MALKGTTKRSSVEQESRVATLYRGKRSPSSGAAVTDDGDVKTADELIECKTSGGPGDKKISTPKFINELGKVVEEARGIGRMGLLTLRYYLPDHYLSNRDGWVEVTVRPLLDDIARTEQVEELQATVDALTGELSDAWRIIGEYVEKYGENLA